MKYFFPNRNEFFRCKDFFPKSIFPSGSKRRAIEWQLLMVIWKICNGLLYEPSFTYISLKDVTLKKNQLKKKLRSCGIAFLSFISINCYTATMSEYFKMTPIIIILGFY